MTQDADTGLFDAITAGIESAGPTASSSGSSDDSNNSDGDESSTSESGGSITAGESDAGGSDAEADESNEDTTGEVDDDAEGEGEKPAGADGEQPDTAIAAKDGKKADDKTAQPAVKDPVNDPLPNALKKETKERIQNLIGVVKEKDATLQKVQSERDELISIITETKASPQQYGDALNYLALVNSGDPAKQEQALQIMQQEVAALAKMLGKPVAGVDMLSEFPDLQQAVRDNLLLQEHAEEMAAARSRTKIQTTQSTQRTQAQAVEQQNSAALTQGREALNQIGDQLRTRDKDVFDRKRDILVPALKPVLAAAHPSQWGEIWRQAYDNLKLPSAPRASTVQGQQPLRAKNPSGGAGKAPASMADAISDAIAQAGR